MVGDTCGRCAFCGSRKQVAIASNRPTCKRLAGFGHSPSERLQLISVRLVKNLHVPKPHLQAHNKRPLGQGGIARPQADALNRDWLALFPLEDARPRHIQYTGHVFQRHLALNARFLEYLVRSHSNFHSDNLFHV